MGSTSGAGFDAPASGVAYWAFPPTPLPPKATERSHVQPCMEQGLGDLRGSDQVSISLEAEVPEVLFDGMREFLNSHPQWDQYRLISSALAGFLFQNGCSDQGVTQHYLNGLILRR